MLNETADPYLENVKLPLHGRRRVVIENIWPQVDCGRFPIKRVPGEAVRVEADIFSDGHDDVTAVLLYRFETETEWQTAPMVFLGNDRWAAEFIVERIGRYYYDCQGRIDHFGTWVKDLKKKFEDHQDLKVDRAIGAEMVRASAQRAPEGHRQFLLKVADGLLEAETDAAAVALSGMGKLRRLMAVFFDTGLASVSDRPLEVVVERREALFSAWYEFFPRSCCREEGSHGTLAQCEELLPRISAMGFDVIYLPPIHPIGRASRKGRNNATVAGEDDPGSPWAIGGEAGGHTAVHRQLGSLDDLGRFIGKAAENGLQVALDIAFQCSPDHPYVQEHPEWFRWRPDGTVQFAENPPKKYQDIIPFDFESPAFLGLWEELRDVILFWIGQGITIFRVDNPHTKPFPFWEYAIRQIKDKHPETIFLAEAFTRPKVMHRLAKLGFSQSYTYFTWRNTKEELEQYLTELTRTQSREYFRPNFWPNTPDILPEVLQFGGRQAFVIRFLLAATLSASYGIYGPPYDLFVAEALPGKEEYLDSEKFEIRCWDWSDPRNMRDLITRVNLIRREHAALQTTWNITFCRSENPNIICCLKHDDAMSSIVLAAINLDPFNGQEGMVEIPLGEMGIVPGLPFLAQDLLSDERHIWHEPANRLAFIAGGLPGKIFRIYPRLRRENQYDYFM